MPHVVATCRCVQCGQTRAKWRIRRAWLAVEWRLEWRELTGDQWEMTEILGPDEVPS
jgi:hypothetical protein